MWFYAGLCFVLFSMIILVAGFAYSFNSRLTRMEVTFDLMGRKAIEAMHSPDDHLGLDHLIDEYVRRNYELTLKEWQELKEICDLLINDKTISHETKALAVLGSALATHKMMLGYAPYKKALIQ